jgi:UMF1 family MFS transporter
LNAPAPDAPAADPYRDRFLPIASWSLYDFANTIFSALVVTQYLPKILKAETGHDSVMGWAMAGSMALSAFLGPFLGALADATGRTKSQVLLWSAVCCAAAVGLSLVPTGHAGWLVAVFVVANVAYNTAISLYDAFLPDLCSPGRMGFVSGIGVGVGYLGALLGYPVALWFAARHGERSAFAVAGVLMAIFSIPFALFVRERTRVERRPFTVALGLREFHEAHATIRALPRQPILLLFLVANFLAADSLNSMIQWAGQFFRDPATFASPEGDVTTLLMGLSVAGVVAGIVAGRVCDALGAHRVLGAAMIALAVVATVDSVASDRRIAMGTTILLGGFGAAGVWLAGRRMLVDLAPPGKLAEFMGILGVTRKASVFGTVLLGTLADARGWRYAILALVAPLLVGTGCLLACVVLRARGETAAAAP